MADEDGARSAPAAPRPGLARLRRNRVASVSGGLFAVVVALCIAAPLYGDEIAHTSANANHITDTVRVGTSLRDVVGPHGVPIGPTWRGRFLLGADANGRDVAVRLLYGGRNSLEIGGLATAIAMALGTLLALLAGYLGGWVDAITARALEVIWSYPVLLLGIALGTSLALGGLDFGVFVLHGNSLVVPALVIGVAFIPYVGRPLRAQVLQLRDREFVDAARAQGMSSLRIMCSELLPNLASSILAFIPLILAQAILLEAALSFLGAGVQDPDPSWGTMIRDGIRLFPGAFHLTLAPGLLLIGTVLAINTLGESVRDTLDPRASLRVAR